MHLRFLVVSLLAALLGCPSRADPVPVILLGLDGLDPAAIDLLTSMEKLANLCDHALHHFLLADKRSSDSGAKTYPPELERLNLEAQDNAPAGGSGSDRVRSFGDRSPPEFRPNPGRYRLIRIWCCTNFVSMRKLTITVDEEVARWARVWAAERNTSVSRLVGELLRERMMEEGRYDKAMRSYLRRAPRRLKRSGRYPSREELHARTDLR